MTPEDLETLVRHLLRDELGIDDSDVSLDTELITTGLLDSVGVVRMASCVERETGLAIPNHDITVDNFGTLRRIQAYVSARQGG